MQGILDKSFGGLTLQRYLQYFATSLGVVYMIYEGAELREKEFWSAKIAWICLANSILYPLAQHGIDSLFKKEVASEKRKINWLLYLTPVGVLLWAFKLLILSAIWLLSPVIGPVCLLIMCVMQAKSKAVVEEPSSE